MLIHITIIAIQTNLFLTSYNCTIITTTIDHELAVGDIIVNVDGTETKSNNEIRNIQIDAVATANLFNFVGDGLFDARNYLTQNGVNLAMWNNTFSEIKKSL